VRPLLVRLTSGVRQIGLEGVHISWFEMGKAGKEAGKVPEAGSFARDGPQLCNRFPVSHQAAGTVPARRQSR
jgi:hypothetical protein